MITTNTTPNDIGTHPPLGIFTLLAVKYARSIVKKKRPPGITSQGEICHLLFRKIQSGKEE